MAATTKKLLTKSDRTIIKAITALKDSRKIIGAQRDKLRKLIDELEDQADCAQSAIDDIDSAIDTLSGLN